jgi:hypothetical protein
MNFTRSFVFFWILIPFLSEAQKYKLENEEIIFSFYTKNMKVATLNKDKHNRYIIYRYGTTSEIEFEYPDTTKNSWTKFTYSYYLRGGGVQNEGMDLDYIYFTNKDYKYIIYNTYYAVGEVSQVGIKIVDLKTDKQTNIKGDIKTRKGNLSDFRDNNLLKIGEEIFD